MCGFWATAQTSELRIHLLWVFLENGPDSKSQPLVLRLWNTYLIYINFAAYDTSLEKIPTSQGLVTLLHICRAIPTTQSSETPRWAPISPRHAPMLPCRAPISSNWTASIGEFHDVLRVFHDILCFTTFTMFYKCSMMVYNVSRCLVTAMIGIGVCTLQSLQGSAIMHQKWSHAKLRLNGDWRNSVPGR